MLLMLAALALYLTFEIAPTVISLTGPGTMAFLATFSLAGAIQAAWWSADSEWAFSPLFYLLGLAGVIAAVSVHAGGLWAVYGDAPRVPGTVMALAAFVFTPLLVAAIPALQWGMDRWRA